MAGRAKTTYHHGDLRRALLDGCFELLDEGGIEAVVMAKAARRAGVSSGAPYRHFRDRTELLHAMAQEAASQFRGAMARAAGLAPSDQAFAAVGIAYVKWAAAFPARYRLITEPSFFKPDEAENEFWAAIRARLDAGAPLDPADPLIRQLVGRAVAHGLASMFAGGMLAAFGIDQKHSERLTLAVTQVTALTDSATDY